MPIGLQTAASNGLSPLETLDLALSHGAQILEWVFFWVSPLGPDAPMARDVAERARATGLLLQLHGPAVAEAIGTPPFASTLDLALAIGADRVTLHLDDLRHGHVPDWQRLEGSPLWIGVENTPFSGPDPSGLVDYLAGLPADSQVGATLDLGHANLSPMGPLRYTEELLRGLSRIGRPIVNVHCHDNCGDRDSHLVPGDGSVPFAQILPMLRDAGVDRFVIERWDEHERALENLRAWLS